MGPIDEITRDEAIQRLNDVVDEMDDELEQALAGEAVTFFQSGPDEALAKAENRKLRVAIKKLADYLDCNNCPVSYCSADMRSCPSELVCWALKVE